MRKSPIAPASRPPSQAAAIRRQMDRLRRSRTFSRSATLSRFLTFVVEKTMRGESEYIKEYTIGVELFGRGETFDPRTDTIVRAHARRLRKKLAEYYLSEADQSDSIVIEMPKGAYVPTFRTRAAEYGVRITTDQPTEDDLARTYLVGRDAELRVLRSRWRSVSDGSSLMLAAVGEAGIGKTVLIECFLESIMMEKTPPLIGRGNCTERLAGTDAYVPFFDALESLLREDEAVRTLMKHCAPWWYSRSVLADSENSAKGAEPHDATPVSQSQIKREIAFFLRKLSHSQSVVLFIEDLHWADVSTIDLIAYLAARSDEMRVLILAAYRPGEMAIDDHPFLRIRPNVLSRGYCHELHLRFLSANDIERYLDHIYPQRDFPNALADVIHGRTEGSPLFVVDYLRHLQREGLILQAEGRWRISPSVMEATFDFPVSVTGMIDRNIHELEKPDRRLLEVASIRGVEFESAVVATVLGIDEEVVEERLQALESGFQFVQLMNDRELPNGRATLRFRFIHVLYQNAIYASVAPTRLARLCRTVAECLEESYGKSNTHIASSLAILYSTARDYFQATRNFNIAANHAIAIFSFREATLLANRGLLMVEKAQKSKARDEEELKLLITLGSAATATHGYGDTNVAETYKRIHALSRCVDASRETILSTFGLHSFYLCAVDFKGALSLCDWYRDIARSSDDLPVYFFAHMISAVTLCFKGDIALSLEQFEAAFDNYDSRIDKDLSYVSAQDVVLAAWNNHPWALWLGGFPSQAICRSEEAAELAKTRSNPHVIVHNFFFAGMLHICLGNAEEVRRLSDAGIELCEKYELPWPLAWGHLLSGWAAARLGESEKGLRLMTQGLDSWRTMGMHLWRPCWKSEIAAVHAREGRLKQGLEVAVRALHEMERTAERQWEPELLRVYGGLLAIQNPKSKKAEECYRSALRVASERGSRSFELRTALSLFNFLRAQDRSDEGRLLLARSYEGFTEGFETHDLQEARRALGSS